MGKNRNDFTIHRHQEAPTKASKPKRGSRCMKQQDYRPQKATKD
jgi:hypothetical protein